MFPILNPFLRKGLSALFPLERVGDGTGDLISYPRNLWKLRFKLKPKSKSSATGYSKSKSLIKSLTIYSAAGLLCLRHFLQKRKQDVRRFKPDIV
jgi:hypothetical protein